MVRISRAEPAPRICTLEGGAVAVTMAFCFKCDRQVHLSDGEGLSCPVCSTPLVETTSEDEDALVISLTPAELAPEVYLG